MCDVWHQKNHVQHNVVNLMIKALHCVSHATWSSNEAVSNFHRNSSNQLIDYLRSDWNRVEVCRHVHHGNVQCVHMSAIICGPSTTTQERILRCKYRLVLYWGDNAIGYGRLNVGIHNKVRFDEKCWDEDEDRAAPRSLSNLECEIQSSYQHYNLHLWYHTTLRHGIHDCYY